MTEQTDFTAKGTEGSTSELNEPITMSSKQFEGKEVLIGQLVGEDEGEKQSAISCRINSSTNQLATKQQPRDGYGE
jgi:hypothetical protein